MLMRTACAHCVLTVSTHNCKNNESKSELDSVAPPIRIVNVNEWNQVTFILIVRCCIAKIIGYFAYIFDIVWAELYRSPVWWMSRAYVWK